MSTLDEVREAAPLFDQARLKSHLAQDKPIKHRLRVLWAAAKVVRGVVRHDIAAAQFCRLAQACGITSALGLHGREDVRHVVDWALRGLNPFESGPLK